MKSTKNDTIKVSMNIDKDIWTKFRIRCLQDGKTATEAVQTMITEQLKKTASK